ncbi:MAG TPA: carbon monoxide dehydrogenase subunit G [Longimicrobiaceae bacterium]|nr:carbon monoxide dehydrogenase subunit G [Longimicrobiaceae bacterium]
MIVEGEYVFDGPREIVYQLLQDPDVLSKAMPGAAKLVLVGDGAYEGSIRVGVGPVTAAEWKLSVALQDRVPPESYVMQVDSSGPVGFTRGAASVALLEVEDGSTVMRYRADLQVGGKVAGIGQRLIDQVAKMMTKLGLDALSKELRARLAGAPALEPGVAEPPGEAPSAAEPAPRPGGDPA